MTVIGIALQVGRHQAPAIEVEGSFAMLLDHPNMIAAKQTRRAVFLTHHKVFSGWDRLPHLPVDDLEQLAPHVLVNRKSDCSFFGVISTEDSQRS